MKVVLERVSMAAVTVSKETVGRIESGFLLLVGFTHSDTEEITGEMARKIANFRVMEDENGKLNSTLLETGGKILAVPQFTLYADTSGRRPGFLDAARPEQAHTLFDTFVTQLTSEGISVETGTFGAFMSVQSINEGPLTLVVEI
ncbi:D-tyrosyl-tRNA(Tyr) deacylase [Candidatus Gottesmanbacteria bacterium]|nr:D-tyrosyl-tRNA(Tyr) deacylase [Candidatus Gottesmanbacteria bacterium]